MAKKLLSTFRSFCKLNSHIITETVADLSFTASMLGHYFSSLTVQDKLVDRSSVNWLINSVPSMCQKLAMDLKAG